MLALRHTFKYLKHFGFVIFELNIVLLCHIQHVNICGTSILKHSELKSHSLKRGFFNTGRLSIKWLKFP